MSEKKTYTQVMQEKLEAERSERKAQAASGDDNGVGTAIGWLFWARLRWFFMALLFFVMAGAVGYMSVRFLVPAAYQMAAFIVSCVVTVFGIIRMIRGGWTVRIIWLGLGIGALVFLIPAMWMV